MFFHVLIGEKKFVCEFSVSSGVIQLGSNQLATIKTCKEFYYEISLENTIQTQHNTKLTFA